MSRKLAAVIALIMVLPALAMAVGPAGGQLPPELTFSSIRDYVLDTNNNTLFDQLVIEIVVEVSQEGTYTVVSDLSVEVSGGTISISTIFRDVHWEIGTNSVEMVFASEDIYRASSSGVFKVDIEVQKFDYAFPWTVVKLTNFYDHRTFEAEENPPPVPPDAPKVEFDVEFVNISTEVFQVFVNRTSPVIIYSYREHRPGMPDFVVTFQRLIFFTDDGDNIYDGEEVAASVVLTNYPWAFMNVEVSGPKVSFDLKARVPITTNDGFAAADVTFTCIVTNGSVSNSESSSFVQGSSELKMDINIEMEDAVVDADHMAVEASVRDTLGSHSYLMEGPSGFKLQSRTNETGYQSVPRLPAAHHTKIGLVDENVVEHAFIGWVNTAKETWNTETGPLDVEVGASFRVIGGALELLMAFPYSPWLVTLNHDPSVGVLEENLPPEPPKPQPPDEPVPNLYLFLFAIIVGSVILILSVYARSQGY
jgi:hypothetical protein